MPDPNSFVVPLYISQATSEAVLGIPARRFREFIARHQIPHTRLGQLVLVSAETMRRWLAVHATEAEQVETEAETDFSAEAIRRRAGLRLAGGAQ